jgi:quercetin dioxygenase-like cupin family protein
MRKILTRAPAFLLSAGLAMTPIASVADTNSKPIVLKVSDIVFHPAPGFPKGAEIVNLRGDLTKAEPYTLRFKIPDGFVIPSHWHTKDEQVTVLSGTLNVGSGDQVDKSSSTALSAGGYQLVPALEHHYVWATGDTIFQVDGIGPRTTAFVNPDEWKALILKSNQ